MTPITTIPWDDLNPRSDEKEQGEKRRVVAPHEMLCFRCSLSECNERAKGCLLRIHHWVDEHGKVRSPKTRAEFLSRKKGEEQEVRAWRQLMREIG